MCLFYRGQLPLLITIPDCRNFVKEEVFTLRLQFHVRTGWAGLFEAVFTWSKAELESGEVVRQDWYSDTSRCVPSSHPHLRPYCIC